MHCARDPPSLRRLRRADRSARDGDPEDGTDPLQRVADLSALFLRTLGPDAVPALVEAFEQAPVDGIDPELALFGMWWARFDPQAAFAWTKTDRRAQFAPVVAAIIRSWAHG